MTREELDARAAELGIPTSSRWKDETVAEKIAEAEKELAAKAAAGDAADPDPEASQDASEDTSEGGGADAAGPQQGAGQSAVPTETQDEGGKNAGDGIPDAGAADSAAPTQPLIGEHAKVTQTPEPDGVLTVIGPKRGRWRAGRHFSPEPVKIPLAELSDDEIAMLAGDPKLTLSGLPQD